jgi:N-methylhydantoinase A/oxoprolinase/acetone carboxylase beta subunit
MKLRLGIDVGGTNTDAVVPDEHATLLARFKSPTTPDVSSGIRNALHGLLSIALGGGSAIIPTDLAGASEIKRLANYDVANAIGAAIAQCSGEIERVFALDDTTRAEALTLSQQLARDEAIKAGADPQTVAIIDVQEVPLAYLPGSATRNRVHAAGNLALE